MSRGMSHMNESCRAHKGVPTDINERQHTRRAPHLSYVWMRHGTYEWVMSHISQATYERVMSRTSRVTQTKAFPVSFVEDDTRAGLHTLRTYEWIMAHVNQSHHTWFTSGHTRMNHVAQTKVFPVPFVEDDTRAGPRTLPTYTSPFGKLSGASCFDLGVSFSPPPISNFYVWVSCVTSARVVTGW